MATKSEIERLAVLETQIKSMAETLNKIDAKLDHQMDNMSKEYVHRSEFETVKRLVYGAVGIILLTVFTALLRLIIV